MNYLHYQYNLSSGDVVVIELDKQANVKLMNQSNYEKYKKGVNHKYYGGLVKKSPFRIAPPNAGKWYLTIDLGGYTGSVNASVNVISI
jgi:hypothetical protein